MHPTTLAPLFVFVGTSIMSFVFNIYKSSRALHGSYYVSTCDKNMLVSRPETCNVIKKENLAQVFSKTPFSQNTSRRLLYFCKTLDTLIRNMYVNLIFFVAKKQKFDKQLERGRLTDPLPNLTL